MNTKKNILCIVGSLNQTTQIHNITKYLQDDYNIYFTQMYGEGFIYKLIAEIGFLDNTILGKNSSFTKMSNQYLRENNLKYDYRGTSKGNKYELAILASDMIVPRSLLKIKTVWIQEGMIDSFNKKSLLVKKLNFPSYFTGDTSLNGTGNKTDLYFAASKGYKDYFTRLGTDKNKIFCTGIPNFDDIQKMKSLKFEHKNFVLVATSDIRELGGNEDRINFISQCVKIANGKQLIFKLHPNENFKKAKFEIQKFSSSNTIIYDKGNIEPMIANCDVLITQFSTTVYLGMILGKKVYSYFDMKDLESKLPIQNEGKSAEIISKIIKEYIVCDKSYSEFLDSSTLAKKYLI